MISDTGFDFADIVDDAAERAGGQAVDASEILSLRRSLRIILERWMAKGYNTFRIATTTISTSATSTSVSLPVCIDDIININAITEGGTEASMTRIGADQYAAITKKDTFGLPSQWWLNRTDPPNLFIFPVGREGMTTNLMITYVERPEEFSRYDPVDDVPGRWVEALVLTMALELARKRPMEGGQYNEGLIQRLKGEAGEAEEFAQTADRDRSNVRIRISH